MIQKDTPPASPDMDNEPDDEEMIYVADIDEIIDEYRRRDLESEEYMEDMEEDIENAEYVSDDEILQESQDNAITRFTGHRTGSVFCGYLSKNGKLASTGGEEDKAYVWDTTTGEILLECTRHKDSVTFAEFNHDETLLGTGDMSGLIQIWRMSDKTRIWDYNMDDATWMKWHMAANVLIACSVNGEIYMWKIPDGDCKVFQGYGCRAETGVIMPDGKRIAVGYEDGSVRVLDLKTTSVLSKIPPTSGHSSTITALDCHPDNNLIISAAVDGKTILSTSQTGKIVSVLQTLSTRKENEAASSEGEAGGSFENADSNWVETVAFCKDPGFQVAATGTVNGEIFIWDIAKQALRQKLEQESGISKLVWKGNTSILFAAGLDGVLRCYDAKTSECLRTFVGHTADILDLYISENGERALTTSDDSTARIFDISSVS